MDQKLEFSPSSVTNIVSPNSPPSSLAMQFLNNRSFSDLSPETSRDFGSEFVSMYRAIFPPKPQFSPLASSLPLTPSTRSSPSSAGGFIGEEHTATEHRLNQARLILESQQLSDHYDLCQSHLHSLNKEIDFLRRENAELRSVNADLLNILSSPAAFRSFLLNSPSACAEAFRGLEIAAAETTTTITPTTNSSATKTSSSKNFSPDLSRSDEISDVSPTSVMEANTGFEQPRNNNNNGVDRVSLPKSISVRSTCYQKTPIPGPISRASTARPRPIPAQPSPPGPQKVYVPAPEKEDHEDEESIGGGLELEVYNQGMFKTELCNKWQQTGACPYGPHCQFAHGISELRPVIRHPRYKTEICRMVLSGDSCPYGHRCHFRHSLTDEERSLLRSVDS